ncbi:putative ribonuclease H-like domain-containing protein [Tanacetum coccineum]
MIGVISQKGQLTLHSWLTSATCSTSDGLESVEARLIVYKKNESVYEEDINASFKREIFLKEIAIPKLKMDFETGQKQKKYEIQLTYIMLFPPPIQDIFIPQKPNLSFSGLEEFMNEPIVSEPTVKKLLFEEEDVPQDKKEKKIVKSSFAKIEFVNSKEQGNPQMGLQDQGVIDSGCSRHMTGNMSYLTDFEEIDGGYVAFGGNPKGGKITSKTDSKLPTTFWAEAVNTACYVQNRVLIIKPHNKTPYERFLGRKPASFWLYETFWVSLLPILNTIDHLGKFDGKADEGFFVGYSINSKAFRVFNNRTRIVEENLHVQFSENTPNIAGNGPNCLFDIDALTKLMNYKLVIVGNQSNGNAGTKACDNASKARMEIEIMKRRLLKNHEKKVVIQIMIKRKRMIKLIALTMLMLLVMDLQLINVNVVSSTVNAAGIEVNAVGAKTSIKLPNDPNMPELEDIVYSDDYEDVGAEADMNNLNTFMPLSVYFQTTRFTQRYLVITNFSGKLVCQPLGFEDPDFPNRVYKVEKVLYGLHQAPRAWYETLSTYLLDNRFQRGKIDKTFFIRRDKGHILLVQVYVDDIIFGSTKKSLCTEFEKMMHKKFQMSSMGELTFFLGLQVKQKEDGIFNSQDKYLKVNQNWASPFDLVAYTDSDYARASLDRKSTTRGCQFLVYILISWQCKKQTIVANSTT